MPRRHKKKSKKQTKKVKEIATKLSKCEISTQELPTTSRGPTILSDEIDRNLLNKWPKLKSRVPPIFLHDIMRFEQNIRKMVALGIKFYKPLRTKNYLKVICESFNDYKNMLQHLDIKQLPYHTFSHPSKRKMKVVIKGLPSDIDLNIIKDELKLHSIPVIRVHKMKTKELKNERQALLLAVLPYDDDGKTIFKVNQLLGYKVVMEPPKIKPKQCHRCQKWGHAQRYCHGVIKCVKCSEEHWTKKCCKTADQEPMCANCGEAHTASYKKCIAAPGSGPYPKVQIFSDRPRILVTMANYNSLYKNVDSRK